MADLNEERMQAALEAAQTWAAHFAEAFAPAVDAFMAFCEELGRSLSAAVDAWTQSIPTEQWEFILAYSWACGAEPEWVRRLNHTKKKRTRKKYQDRILRAYRETRRAGDG